MSQQLTTDSNNLVVDGNLTVHGTITTDNISSTAGMYIDTGATDHSTWWSNDTYNGYVTLNNDHTWNVDTIELITRHEDGRITVHEELVNAILNKILSNEELADKLLSKLMELVLQKSEKLKMNSVELKKTFDD